MKVLPSDRMKTDLAHHVYHEFSKMCYEMCRSVTAAKDDVLDE